MFQGFCRWVIISIAVAFHGNIATQPASPQASSATVSRHVAACVAASFETCVYVAEEMVAVIETECAANFGAWLCGLARKKVAPHGLDEARDLCHGQSKARCQLAFPEPR